MGKYAKAIVAIVLAGVTALQVGLNDGTISNQEWITIAIATITAIGVYAIPNSEQ